MSGQRTSRYGVVARFSARAKECGSPLPLSHTSDDQSQTCSLRSHIWISSLLYSLLLESNLTTRLHLHLLYTPPIRSLKLKPITC